MQIRSHFSLAFLHEKQIQCILELYKNKITKTEMDNWYGGQTQYLHQTSDYSLISLMVVLFYCL